MNDIFRSQTDIKRIGSLYHCVCLSCGTFVGASASLECLKIAERQHRCKPSYSFRDAALDSGHVAQRNRSTRSAAILLGP